MFNWLYCSLVACTLSSSPTLSEIPVILGTHHSAALTPRHCLLTPAFHCFAQCQTHTIEEQLDFGIRFLDIRLTPTENGDFCVSHHFTCLQTFDEVIEDVTRFLQLRPTEFVILYVRIDSAYLQTKQPVPWSVMANKIASIESLAYPNKPLAEMTLSELAGKVVICSENVIKLPSRDLTWSHKKSFELTDMWYPALSAEDRKNRLDKYVDNCINDGFGKDRVPCIAFDAYWDSCTDRDRFIEALHDVDLPRVGVVMIDKASPEVAEAIMSKFAKGPLLI